MKGEGVAEILNEIWNEEPFLYLQTDNGPVYSAFKNSGKMYNNFMEEKRFDGEFFYTSSREAWRTWLLENYRTAKEVWFVFPMKGAGEEGLSYNDAVEEALCFGWIDSTIRNIDGTHRAQHFTPRKKGVGELGLILKRIKKWYNGICCV